MRKQIDAAESIVLATERLTEPATFTEAVALGRIKDGAERQITGLKSVTRTERIVRGAVIGVASLGIAGYAGTKAFETGSEVPGLVVERATSELPAKIGTQEVNIFGVHVTLPSVEETLQLRDDRIVEAQKNLDNAIDSTVTNTEITVIALAAGVAGEVLFAKNGLDPVGRTRRIRGSIDERRGWSQLGTTKDELKRKYQRRDAGILDKE